MIPNISIKKTIFVWHGDKKYNFTSPRFQLVFLASGMVSGGVRFPSGEWLYKNSGEITDSRLLLVPPGASFFGEFNQPSQEFAVFEFDCDNLEYDPIHCNFKIALDDGSFQRLTPSQPLLSHEVLRLRPMVATASDRFTYDPDSEGLKLSSAMGVIGLMTWLLILPECPPSNRDLSPAARLKVLIDKEPGWKVPMTDMFKKIGRSPQTLRREFRKEFGETPMHYREQKRRQIAFTYIRLTHLPLKTICARLGMKSPTHLSIYIRRVTGKTPRELRAEAQSKHRRISRSK